MAEHRAAPSVTVSGGRAEPPPPRRHRTGPVVAVLLGVLLAPIVVDLAHSVRVRAERRTAALSRAEDRALRLVVTGGAADSPGAAAPPDAVQVARIRLRMHNGGPSPVRVLAASVDGGPRSRLRLELRPGAEVEVPAGWQVRCAEVGALAGPRLMTVRVRGRIASHDVRVPLPAAAPGLHLAAVRACDVLVPPS